MNRKYGYRLAKDLPEKGKIKEVLHNVLKGDIRLISIRSFYDGVYFLFYNYTYRKQYEGFIPDDKLIQLIAWHLHSENFETAQKRRAREAKRLRLKK